MSEVSLCAPALIGRVVPPMRDYPDLKCQVASSYIVVTSRERVCVRVCVCERERERERERARASSYIVFISCVFVCVIEKERARERPRPSAGRQSERESVCV